jgi:hypothetical protein
MGDIFSGLAKGAGGIAAAPFGLFGAAPNNAFFEAQNAPILNPVNQEQINQGFGQNQDLIRALLGQNALQNQSSVFNQLQGVANGQGPNPALAQHNIMTGQNVANQAALQAGQRGASANPGLIARQIGQQGAQIQQQGAGQSALLQALQQLQALGQLGGMANTQAGQLQSAVQGNTGQLLGGANIGNQANVANTGNMNETNQRMAGVNANNTKEAYGALAKGLSAYGGAGGGSKGLGAVGAMNQGGQVENPKLKNVPSGDRLSTQLYPAHLKAAQDIYHGQSFEGGSFDSGGKVPGKAEVQGDSRTNDQVPALLSPGEFVIPKSIMESENPIAGAAKMIADYQKKNGKGGEGKKRESDFKNALRKAIAGRKTK